MLSYSRNFLSYMGLRGPLLYSQEPAWQIQSTLSHHILLTFIIISVLQYVLRSSRYCLPFRFSNKSSLRNSSLYMPPCLSCHTVSFSIAIRIFSWSLSICVLLLEWKLMFRSDFSTRCYKINFPLFGLKNVNFSEGSFNM